MKKTLLHPLAACALLALAALAHAQSGTLLDDYRKVMREGKITHVVDIDNDSLMLNRNDGFYTSGMFYTQRRSLRNGADLTTFAWRIGQELYTASDINLPPALVGPPDRPYAGWLFGGVFREIHRADGSHSRVGIDIGCLGPCAGGEWTQTNLHRLLNQPLPQAWSRQVKNEFGVVLHGEYAPLRWNLGSSVDLRPSIHGRFGNIYTDAGAGLLLRAGRLNTLPDQPTLHGFLRLDARYVGYNATLQGGYFSSNNPHTVAPKRAVGEVEGGVAWTNGVFGLKASVARRSNEVRDLSNSVGNQTYARLQFSYTH